MLINSGRPIKTRLLKLAITPLQPALLRSVPFVLSGTWVTPEPVAYVEPNLVRIREQFLFFQHVEYRETRGCRNGITAERIEVMGALSKLLEEIRS